MTFILSVLSTLVSLGKVVLGALSLVKKSGADEKDNEILKEEVAKNEKDIKELAKANEFMLRLQRDPAYRERMRNALNSQSDDGDGKTPSS